MVPVAGRRYYLGRHDCVVCALFVSTNVIAETIHGKPATAPNKARQPAGSQPTACLDLSSARLYSRSFIHSINPCSVVTFRWLSFCVSCLTFRNPLICAVSHVKARLSPSTLYNPHDAIMLQDNVARTNKNERGLWRSCSLVIGHNVNLAGFRLPGTTKATCPCVDRH